MDQIITTTNTPLPFPEPKIAINIRLATMADFDWMDGLQKKHNKMIGWQTRGAFEGKIKLDEIIVAEERVKGEGVRRKEEENGDSNLLTPYALTLNPSAKRIGYCMGGDRYLKRDELGIIYQMNIEPAYQRSFIGSALLKAMFERSAYGCKLYCCWCAQDIAANKFWESMGFTAIAFRTGSKDKGPDGGPRTHIFWQKRIRSGDETTPFWYPCKTEGGSMGDERLVFPIPPGTHWSDAMPIVLPGMELENRALPLIEEEPKIRRASTRRQPERILPKKGPCQIGMSKLSFALAKPEPAKVEIVKEKKKKEKKPRAKFDKAIVAKARELRDRYLEAYNNPTHPLLESGKYDAAKEMTANNKITALLLNAA